MVSHVDSKSNTQALLERARDPDRFADPATHQVIAEAADAIEALSRELAEVTRERGAMAEAISRVLDRLADRRMSYEVRVKTAIPILARAALPATEQGEG